MTASIVSRHDVLGLRRPTATLGSGGGDDVIDDVIVAAGARSSVGVPASERVDDDVLQTSSDVVLQTHDRPSPPRLALTWTPVKSESMAP